MKRKHADAICTIRDRIVKIFPIRLGIYFISHAIEHSTMNIANIATTDTAHPTTRYMIHSINFHLLS